ncbi:flagellar basal body P-ring formation chaperone FlgA, partial [Candidatus Latescibacterota bacterium]
DAIAQHIKEISEDEDIDFVVTVPSIFDVDIGDVDTPDIHVSHDAGKKIGQILPVTVKIKDDNGEIIRQIRLATRLKKFAVAAVLNKDIKRGEPIEISDVVIKKADITGVKNFYTSLSEVSGMQAEKSMRAGTVLSGLNLRTAYLVRRGDKVIVEVLDGGFFVSAEGTARESGSMGEYINVYIDMTNTTISCKIIDSKTVITGIEGG